MIFTNALDNENARECDSKSKLRVDMNKPSSSDLKFTSKLEDEEAIFDSGILSESNIYSETLSEEDVKYTVEGASGHEKPSVDSQSSEKIAETESQMRLDSGIDIDLSDQIYSRSDSCSLEKCPEEVSKQDALKVPPVVNTVSWEQFFEQDEDGNTKLHEAIINGDVELVKRILPYIPKSDYLNIRNNYFQTCLHLTIFMNQPEITRLLLLAGAKTGVEDRNGDTPLHVACKRHNHSCVKALLYPITVYEKSYIKFQYTPEIDSPAEYLSEYNYDGLSCTHIAAGYKNLPILEMLFVYGADVNIRECKSGYTVLHEAVLSGDLEMVKFILRHPKLDIERQNYARLTAYQLSSYYPSVERVLRERGASRLVFAEDLSDDEDSSSDEGESDDDYSYGMGSWNEQVSQRVQVACS